MANRSLTLNCPRCGEATTFYVDSADVDPLARRMDGSILGLTATVRLTSGHGCQ